MALIKADKCFSHEDGEHFFRKVHYSNNGKLNSDEITDCKICGSKLSYPENILGSHNGRYVSNVDYKGKELYLEKVYFYMCEYGHVFHWIEKLDSDSYKACKPDEVIDLGFDTSLDIYSDLFKKIQNRSIDIISKINK